MINFDQYYLKYLDVDAERMKAGHRVFPCKRRADSFAFFYVQHLISTIIDGKVIFSVSPEFAPAFEIQGTPLADNLVNEELLKIIDDTFFDFLPVLLYSTRLMMRMTLDKGELVKQKAMIQVNVLSESDKARFISRWIVRGEKSTEYLWNARAETIRAGRYFTAFEKDEIASSAYISDIDYQGANITVGTGLKFRKKGYGKAVVSHATEWCFSHGYRPIYLVDINNKPSIKLAESLGFREMSREVIVSSYNEIH
ncbi:MAG: GNAT family N-acetyltransferase [Candidatus Aegiribacteria sp.]|nr:GNAT family N-acetyltransferase [Candidatus Aegiribacteria sp.]